MTCQYHDFPNPELVAARNVMINPRSYCMASLRDACDFAKLNGDRHDRELADSLQRAIRADLDDRIGRDPVSARRAYAKLALFCVLFWVLLAGVALKAPGFLRGSEERPAICVERGLTGAECGEALAEGL